MELEYKAFDFKMETFRVDEKYAYFEGYLSTFGNVDLGDDVVVKGAFTESLLKKTPSLLWSHNGSEPLGIFESLVEDQKGLYVKAKMPLADSFVKERIVPQMEIGSIKSMSIGYWIPEYQKNVEFRDDVRYLKKVSLMEGSLVVIPMNDQATIKSLENQKITNLKELNERELEKAFHEGSAFSKKDSKMLVSFVKAGLVADDQDAQRDAEEKEKKEQEEQEEQKKKETEATQWSEIISSIKQIENKIEEK